MTGCHGVASDDADRSRDGIFDKDGCNVYSFILGDTDLYGPGRGFTADTSKPLTWVAQFLSNDGAYPESSWRSNVPASVRACTSAGPERSGPALLHARTGAGPHRSGQAHTRAGPNLTL